MRRKYPSVALAIFAALLAMLTIPSDSAALDGPVCWELKDDLKMPEGLEGLAEALETFPSKICITGLEVAGAVPDPEASDILYKAIRVTGTVGGHTLKLRSKNKTQEGIYCSRVSRCKLSQSADNKLRYAAVIESRSYRYETAEGDERVLKADVIVSFDVMEKFQPTGTPTIRAEIYESNNGSEAPVTRVATTFVRSVASTP